MPTSITVQLNIQMPYAIFQDIDADWRTQIQGTVGSLSTAIATTDTSLTLASATTIASGTCIMIDQEPMTVASDVTNSATVPVSRGTSQTSTLGTNSYPSAVVAAHNANSTITVLTYSTPWSKIALEGFDPYSMSIVQKRGQKSYTLSSTVTGTVTATV